MHIAVIHASCDIARIQSRTNICMGKHSGAKLILNAETLVIDDITMNNNVGILCCTKKLVYSQLLQFR
jgi:hypothetical protein